MLFGSLWVGAAQAQTTSFSYDALGRLRTVASDDAASTYTYDAAGNRTQVIVSVPDTTPAAFNLGGPVTGATAGAWVSSSSPTISGINTASPVTVSNAQYRINGGSWVTTAGTVTSGQTVQVRVQASSTAGASQLIVLK